MGQDPESLLSYDDFVKRPESLFGLPCPVTEEIEKVGGLMSDVFQTIQEKVDEKTGKTLLFRDGEDNPTERTLEGINAKFNEELQRQVDGVLPEEKLLNFLDQQRTNHADVAFVFPDKQVKTKKSKAS